MLGYNAGTTVLLPTMGDIPFATRWPQHEKTSLRFLPLCRLMNLFEGEGGVIPGGREGI